MDPSLARLAQVCGVASAYHDWAHRPVAVSEDTVRKVLAGLGIDVSDPAAALVEWEAASWERVLPPTVVVRRGAPQQVAFRCPAESSVRAEIRYGTGAGEQVTILAPGPPAIALRPATGSNGCCGSPPAFRWAITG